jgi:hypothetical protein
VKRNQEWFEEVPSYSYGAAFADLDNDGDLDYVVNNLDDEAFLYRNNTIEKAEEEANFLRIHLKGIESNSMAIGAKVELWCQGSYQYQEHFLSRGYASSVDPQVHFGLSEHTLIDSLKVTWPSGNHISELAKIEANQWVEIEEKDALPIHEDSREVQNPGYLFSEVEGVISYEHQQEDYVDFHLSQSIIPHKFSQIGPCMEKGDLNMDGQEDIIIGATNTSPTRVFLRGGNKFTETEIKGLSTRKEFSESGFAIVDVDQDGDNDIVALAGGYENEEDKYIHYLYENKQGSFSKSALPTTPFPAAVVRPCDFDHDGDMDLFIGARIGLEIFPFSANSWLLVNDQGSFKTENTLNFYLGMVTDAVWSDYNGDGWEDLLVTREWNSVALLQNMQGRGVQIQEVPEVEFKHGIWSAIVSGDFDQDGDNDYILGNLGENHRFTVSEQYPMRIYALDIDLNGTLDPIHTGFWKDQDGEMKEFPVHYFDELMTQSPYFLKNLENYTSFSYATIDDILGPGLMERVDYTLHTNTSSSYILWNQGSNFRWERLPDRAQEAPITAMIVRDFNKDSYPDVLLAGNEHSYDISTGYYDANKGLLLLSKNNQPLSELQTSSQSGFMLHGMVTSLLFLEGETPLVVAGLNRKKAKVFSVTSSTED